MEEENKVSSHAFNVKTEVVHNLIGGFIGGLLGYWCGAFAGPWLAYILFFVFGYLGYNFKQTLETGRKVFTIIFSEFWFILTTINPHPIITLPVFVYISIISFAAACDGISVSDTFCSLDKIWLGLQANLTWKNTGVNPFAADYSTMQSLAGRTTWFYCVGVICLGVSALFAAASGWAIKFSIRCVKHPKQIVEKIIALYALAKKANPYPIVSALVLALCGYQLITFAANALPVHERPIGIVFISFSICATSCLFWFIVGALIPEIITISKTLTAMHFKQAMLSLLKMFFMAGFYSTFGLAIVIIKAIVLTIIGIHSARRLACGLSTLLSGTLYMIFVPFSIETVPLAMLAIGCGLAGAAVCALVAVALDGESAYHCLDAFVKKPIRSFAPSFLN